MFNLKQVFSSVCHYRFLRVSLYLAVMLAVVSAPLSAADNDIENIRNELVGMIPQAKQAEIIATQAQGVYRVMLKGEYIFAYADGDHVLIGDLYNTKSRKNLGDEANAQLISTKIDSTPTSKMIIFGPEDAKRHITVFTDIDCGYCRKLHNEVAALNAAGIQVRYLAFPRAGIESASYDKYVSVWCNKDQQTSLTNAKLGKPVPNATCENPIAETYMLGQEIGVRGTPTMIFDDGSLVPGYMPADKLIARLGLDPKVVQSN